MIFPPNKNTFKGMMVESSKIEVSPMALPSKQFVAPIEADPVALERVRLLYRALSDSDKASIRRMKSSGSSVPEIATLLVLKRGIVEAFIKIK